MARGAVARVDIRQKILISAFYIRNIQHHRPPHHAHKKVLVSKNLFRDPRNLDSLASGIVKTVLEVL